MNSQARSSQLTKAGMAANNKMSNNNDSNSNATVTVNISHTEEWQQITTTGKAEWNNWASQHLDTCTCSQCTERRAEREAYVETILPVLW
jgi:hypothetical protein